MDEELDELTLLLSVNEIMSLALDQIDNILHSENLTDIDKLMHIEMILDSGPTPADN